MRIALFATSSRLGMLALEELAAHGLVVAVVQWQPRNRGLRASLLTIAGVRRLSPLEWAARQRRVPVIFNTDFKNLNLTLKILGGASYVYSIYTNFIGIQHIFGFSDFIAASGAAIMDVLPEAFIAWALGEHLQGDLLGNLGKLIMGTPSNGKEQNNETRRSFASDAYTHMPDTQPRMKPIHDNHKGKGSERRAFLEKEKSKNETPNRFNMLEE